MKSKISCWRFVRSFPMSMRVTVSSTRRTCVRTRYIPQRTDSTPRMRCLQSRTARPIYSCMGDARSTTKFFVALVALVVALVAVGALGLRGLASVKHADDQVFSDNFLTSEATNRLNTDLSRAERLALEIAATSDARVADRRR